MLTTFYIVITLLSGHTHSVNPCLVVGARSAALDGEPAVQESKRRILLRFTAADIGQSGEVDKGARAIVSRP
jgi:hypothetical protein